MPSAGGRAIVFILGVIGASMFLGDCVITPAISVLSAVEGLKLASPAFGDYVAPLTVFVLVGLFAAQSRGTAKVAALFGPVMVVWFVAIAIAGALHILDDPHVLAGDQSALRRSPFCSITAKSVWSRSVPYFSWSPAARRSMPISVISAASRSRPPGSAWCCRRC